jgi:hypothetical protein
LPWHKELAAPGFGRRFSLAVRRARARITRVSKGPDAARIAPAPLQTAPARMMEGISLRFSALYTRKTCDCATGSIPTAVNFCNYKE